MLTPILREWYVALSIAIPTFSVGIMFAFPATLIPGITSEDSDIRITKDGAVWVAAAYNISGVFSFLIVPLVMQHYGRRACNAFVHIFIIIGSVTTALSQDVIKLIIGRCLQGMSFGGVVVANILLAEYCHPKRRGIFVIFKMLSIYLGVFLLHGLSFVLTWRQLAWLSLTPSIYGVVTTFTWPESPFWLAYKGRFNDCIEAFELLRGKNEESQTELGYLLLAQKETLKKNKNINVFQQFIKAITTKDFLLPFAIALFNVILVQSSGLAYLIAYIIEIMLVMSNGDRSKALYYTLGYDVMKMSAMLISIYLERILKRRTLLFSGGCVTIFSLLCVCLLQYLIDTNVLKIVWLAPACLILFNFLCNATIIPAVCLISGEIFPLEYKGLGSAMIGLLDASMVAFTIRFTPSLLESIKVYGTFLIYSGLMVGSLLCIYFTLPETKNRPLQDIESEFINITITDFNESQVLEIFKLITKDRV